MKNIVEMAKEAVEEHGKEIPTKEGTILTKAERCSL